MQFDIREKNKKLQNTQHLIQNFEVTRFLSLLYTGGKVCVSNNEKFFISCAEQTANVVDFHTGEVLSELVAVCTNKPTTMCVMMMIMMTMIIILCAYYRSRSGGHSHPIYNITNPVCCCTYDIYKDDIIITIALSPNDKQLAVSTRNGSVHLFSISQQRLISTFAAGGSVSAKTPVIQMCYNQSGTLMALATGDSKIRIYSLTENRFISQLQTRSSGAQLSTQVHTGRISLLQFSTDINFPNLLVSSALDGVKLWDVEKSRGEQIIAWVNRDLGDVTSVTFSPKNKWMITGGDEILKVYDYSELEKGLGDVKTIPVKYTISGIALVDEEKVAVVSIDNSEICIWNLESEELEKSSVSSDATVDAMQEDEDGEEAASDSDDEDEDEESTDTEEKQQEVDVASKFFKIVQMVYAPNKKTFLCVTHDGNFIFYSYPELKRERQVVGFNDEILDVCLLMNKKKTAAALKENNNQDQRELLIATNGEKILRVNMHSKSVQFLCGHREVVLGICADSNSERFAVSCSKDRTVRVWDLVTEQCVAVGDAHSKSVSGIAYANTNKKPFFVTASDDKTVKVWDMAPLYERMKQKDIDGDRTFTDKDVLPIRPDKSVNAHTKEINQIALSPNDEFLATASSDKTVKIWKVDTMELVKTIQHPKGVYSVAFSPIDKTIVTGCGDSVTRIYSLTNGNLLKIFPQDTMHGVLKVSFVRNGAQLVTIDAGGLLKLWSVRYGNCLANFDEHSDRVWGLAISDKQNDQFLMVTGGEDSRVNIWKDSTLEVVQEQKREIDESVRMEQQFKNLARNKQYLDAIKLAIKADRPRQVYTLIEQFLGLRQDTKKDSETLAELIRGMEYTDVMTLFQYTLDWNTNSKFCGIAQRVLHSMFSNLDPSFINTPYEKSVQALIGYSEKHIKRVQHLLQRSYLLDYVLSNMKMVAPESDESLDAMLNGPNTSDSMNNRKTIVDPELVTEVPIPTVVSTPSVKQDTPKDKVENNKKRKQNEITEDGESKSVTTPVKKPRLNNGDAQKNSSKKKVNTPKNTPKKTPKSVKKQK